METVCYFTIGKLKCMSAQGNDIGVYSAETGQRVFDLDEHFDSVQCLHYHPQHEARYIALNNVILMMGGVVFGRKGRRHEGVDARAR